jgi:nicotinamidase-related amidase
MQVMEQACRARGIPIFFAQANHRPDYKDFVPRIVDRWMRGNPGDGPMLSSHARLVADTPGAQIIPELGPYPEDYVIKKHRWSPFFQTSAELLLRTRGVDTLLIAGGAIEIGIASTVYAARDLDYNMIILRDLCTGAKPELKRMFLDELLPVFTRVMTVDEAIALMPPAGVPAGASAS